MGETPCEADCSLFGSLCQIKYQMPGTPFEKYITGKKMVEFSRTLHKGKTTSLEVPCLTHQAMGTIFQRTLHFLCR